MAGKGPLGNFRRAAYVPSCKCPVNISMEALAVLIVSAAYDFKAEAFRREVQRPLKILEAMVLESESISPSSPQPPGWAGTTLYKADCFT